MFNYTRLKTNLIKSTAALLTLLFSAFSYAGVDTETDENGVILAGHDAVAYFTEGKPVEGKASITAVHNDAIYRFSSDKNRSIFLKNPAKYAPAYGGSCAYGMTFGKKFEIDGKAFEVVDGVLYVNKNPDVYKAWKKDVPKHLKEANREWPSVKDIAASKL
jgi:YHS domain-containing protein